MLENFSQLIESPPKSNLPHLVFVYAPNFRSNTLTFTPSSPQYTTSSLVARQRTCLLLTCASPADPLRASSDVITEWKEPSRTSHILTTPDDEPLTTRPFWNCSQEKRVGHWNIPPPPTQEKGWIGNKLDDDNNNNNNNNNNKNDNNNNRNARV